MTSTRYIFSTILGLLLILCAQPSLALFGEGEHIIDVNNIPDSLEADPYVYYLEDHLQELEIKDFISGDAATGLLKSPGGVLNRGYSEAAIWMRLRMNMTNPQALPKIEKVLQISYPLLDHISVFQVIDNKLIKEWATGDSLPFQKRPVDHNSYLFPINVEKNKLTDVYIRVVSSSSLRIPLLLWDPIHFFQTQKSVLLVDGLYYGILFLMLFYNLCLYSTVRDKTYLYYILYIVGIVAFQSTMNGYGFEFIWPHLPVVNSYIVGSSICGIALFMILFACQVLETKQAIPRFHIALQCLAILQPILIGLCFFLPYSVIIKPIILNALLCSISMILIGIILATHSRTAKLFLFAWTTMLVGAMLLAAASMGWIEANILTTNAFSLGSAIEVTLLSFTLAERMRSMQKQQTEMEKDAKEMLQKANSSLVESNKLKDEFLATISHELRTPMNGVIGCLENIRGEIQDRKVSAFIESADRSAQQMMLLVDGILTYTEIYSHGLRLDRAPFDVDKLMQSLEALYRDTAESRGLEFEIVKDDRFPTTLIGDRRQLLQILSNLTDNAIKFTPHGYVRLSFITEHVDVEKEIVNLSITISDSGIGINAEKSHLIFEKFRQADGSFHRTYGGLGIGLAICKELTDLMGAKLDFSSSSKGTDFILKLALPFLEEARPRCNSQDANNGDPAEGLVIESTTESQTTIPEGLTALVVEDNHINQMVLKGILKKLKCEVITAENGQEALEQLQQHQVDVILMDCQMPVMDGFQATRAIRALPDKQSQVPIIAVTANAMAKDRETCLEAGMNDHLSKPVKAHQIKQALSKWLSSSIAA
ncbi:MAG: response regulator [Pseudomonadales bacterium]|nr:response regulator [Pseudomonadales bacterium]